MKQLVFFLLFFISLQSKAQKIRFSDIITQDDRNIFFEILGKVQNNYVIYKKVRWKHMLSVYNEKMELKENDRITFIPDNTFNIDFIIYPDHFYMIYQYQNRNVIWCKAVKMNSNGKKLSEPVTLDTSRSNLITDIKIYNTVFSEDRKKILVYKMVRKNDKLNLVSKLYDSDLLLLDSARQILPFNDGKDNYSDLTVDNTGSFIFTRQHKNGWSENVTNLDLYLKSPSMKPAKYSVPLQNKFVDEVKSRIDNRNGNYILNSLFSRQKSGSIHGLFTAVINRSNPEIIRTAFNVFDDSLRAQVNEGGQFSTAFDNLFLRNTYVKRDGGFLLTAEDFYTQSNSDNSSYRRSNNLYNNSSSPNYDYYQNNSSYNSLYRPYTHYVSTIRYYYDDILVVDIDSSLNMKWHTVIHKKQAEDEHDNFLSYATINAGSEIHFLFNDRKNQNINNHSILAGGEIKRYPTVKSYEEGFEFMPKLAKQVGVKQVIIPCVYLGSGSLRFARIDFSE